MRVLAIVAAMLCSDAAWASGYSADIEMVRPTWGQGAMPGVDEARRPVRRDIRVGLVGQYERNPLILRTPTERVESVVGNRIGLDLGVSMDLSHRLTMRATLPFAGQWGSTSVLSTDRFGARDLGVGGTFRVTGDDALLDMGLRADVAAPLGAKDAWLGEALPRISGGLVLGGTAGGVRWSGDVGVVGRAAVETAQDLTLGPEAWVGANARYPLDDRLTVLGGAVARIGFLETFGGGETGVEALAGLRITPGRGPSVDLLLGKGFGNGYGTTDVRVLCAVTWAAALYKEDRRPKVEDEEPDVPEERRAEVLPERSFEIEAPVVEKPLAQLVGSKIEIRDPIQFELDTARVLPESLPTLRAVAALVQPGDLLVIEGHASQEGTFEHNYELSAGRAKSIYEELVRGGISPSNLAWRALGEVAPASTGMDEKHLAENRRVNFYVVHLSDMPPPTPIITLPWDGTTVPARAPGKPPETP